MNNFYDREQICSITFSDFGPCWHLNTPENHPILFTCDAEFEMAMNIIAICARLHPNVRIITFEWMSNHLHVLGAGQEADLHAFFASIKQMLCRQLKDWGRPDTLSQFVIKLRPVLSLDDARNVLVYDNRNGFLVNPATTPFTYPWGANRFFFNDEAKKRYFQCHGKLTRRQIRDCSRGRYADAIDDIHTLDGYASPMDFCDIAGGERLFRDARHYFYALSRNIESQKKIAAEIGERIFYTDDELFTIIVSLCKDRYGTHSPGQLPAQAKVEVARLMHFDYNASNKQIQRILRLEARTVESLFPSHK